MEVDSNAKPVVKVVKQSITPEVEVYLHLLVLLVLAQRDNKTQVLPTNSSQHNSCFTTRFI
jgi:hypothetical protein